MYAMIQQTVHNYIYFTAVIDLKLFYLVPNDCPPPALWRGDVLRGICVSRLS